jgi:hypothetical protein
MTRQQQQGRNHREVLTGDDHKAKRTGVVVVTTHSLASREYRIPSERGRS